MKKVIFFLTIFCISVSVYADWDWTYAKSINGTYKLYLSDQTSPSDVFTFSTDGTVISHYNKCNGKYSMSWHGFLFVTYSNECDNFSWNIDIGEANLNQMRIGEEAFVITRAIRLYHAPKNGILKRAVTMADLVGTYQATTGIGDTQSLTITIRKGRSISLSDSTIPGLTRVDLSIFCHAGQKETLLEDNVLQANMSCTEYRTPGGSTQFQFPYTIDFNGVLELDQFQISSSIIPSYRNSQEVLDIEFKKQKTQN